MLLACLLQTFGA